MMCGTTACEVEEEKNANHALTGNKGNAAEWKKGEKTNIFAFLPSPTDNTFFPGHPISDEEKRKREIC